VGARPASPANTLTVAYRVDGGMVHTASGREVRTNYDRQVQYFDVTFPEFVTGDVVQYSPLLRCGGRQAPSPRMANEFPSKFQLVPKSQPVPAKARAALAPGASSQPPGRRYAADLEFLAHVSVCFDGVEYVTDTASGMRVNFFVREGTIEGPEVTGKVVANSADHMIIRPDGIGLIRIRAVFETNDGARLDMESGGQVEFGDEGYKRAQAHALPDSAPLVVTPLISTRHPRYRRLSRGQCIGVGQTHLGAGQTAYYVHAVMPRNLT